MRSRISMSSRSAVLRPMPGMRVSAADVLRLDAAHEGVHVDAGKEREPDLGPDARHAQQVAEQAPLVLGRESVQQVRVLAHDEVGVQLDLAADAPAGGRTSTSAPRARSRRR